MNQQTLDTAAANQPSLTQAALTRDLQLASIVVPTYREAENLYDLVVRIANALAPQDIPYEVIVVDDNSQDGTEDVICELQSFDYPVRLITRTDQRGLSSAVLRGFREAEGDVLICMDADLSHPPERLPELVGALRDPEIDFVVGSRYVAGGSTAEDWGVCRWVNSKIATLLARPFTKLRDPMAGYFAIPKAVFERSAELNPVGYKIGLEILVKARCRNPIEVPIEFAQRHRGESKLSFTEQLRYLRHLRRLANFKFKTRMQLLQFGMVGVTGLFVDLTLYATFLSMGLIIPLARAMAIWLAMSCNFVMNRRFTFAHARKLGFAKSYFRYVLGCGMGAITNWTLSTMLPKLIPFFAMHLMLSAVCGAAVAFTLNFTVSRFWAFRHEQLRN